jgi:hypothetical protein
LPLQHLRQNTYSTQTGCPKGIYERLSTAFSAAERITAQNIHILDENNNKVIMIKYSGMK